MSERPKEQALAIPETTGIIKMSKQSVAPHFYTRPPGIITSMPLVTEDDKLDFLDMLNGVSEGASNYINTVLDVVNFTVFPGEKVNTETGEVEEFPGVYLHLTGQKNIRLGSWGVYRSIMGCVSLDITPPFNPPRQFKLVQEMTSQGFTTLKLYPVRKKKSSGK